MIASPQPHHRQDRSLRSPETAQVHLAQKVDAIYNSLREHKLDQKESDQHIDIYTPDILLRILDAKVTHDQFVQQLIPTSIGRTSSK